MVRQLHNCNLCKGEMPSGVEERERIPNDSDQDPEGVPSTHVRSCVTSCRDNLIIDDGIRYWVKMLNTKW